MFFLYFCQEIEIKVKTIVYILLIGMLSGTLTEALAERNSANPYTVLDITGTAKKKRRFFDGHNIKMCPAFFFNTIGIEGEYAIKPHLTFGGTVFLKYGRTDGIRRPMIIRNEDYLGQGYRIEIQGKYYLKQDKKNRGPYGLYVQANLAYGNTQYYDGTARPYTLNSRWREFLGLSIPTQLDEPKKISFGAGFGYQVIFIPKRFIANVMVGTQLGFGQKNPFVSIYVHPSIGYILK